MFTFQWPHQGTPWLYNFRNAHANMSTMIIIVDPVNWYSMSLSIRPLKHEWLKNQNNFWALLHLWHKTLPYYILGPVDDKLVVQSPPPQAPINVEANKEEVSTNDHPCNDQFMRNRISSPRTHSSMEKDTTAVVDAFPLIGQQSCAVLNLIHLKCWKLMLKKAMTVNRLSLPLGRDING